MYKQVQYDCARADFGPTWWEVNPADDGVYEWLYRPEDNDDDGDEEPPLPVGTLLDGATKGRFTILGLVYLDGILFRGTLFVAWLNVLSGTAEAADEDLDRAPVLENDDDNDEDVESILEGFARMRE